jgi:pimeloyl-ACP methyl ester carboxylesterase
MAPELAGYPQIHIPMCSQRLLLFFAILAIGSRAHSQSIPYGNNPATGRYVNVGDANMYCEIYGKGQPLVMLHGGVYGYIDEFESLIPKLAEHYQVICIATRGHGKSEIGTQPFTYRGRAEDAYKVIRSITSDSITVVGFSEGGFTGLELAALHPELVKRLVAMGVGNYPIDHSKDLHYTPEDLMKQDSAFFAGRLKLMPEPGRWREFLNKSNDLYNNDQMGVETFGKIKCPVLVMAGEKDSYNHLDNVLICARAIPDHQLSIIPGCDHVILYCNFPAVWEAMKPFVIR